MLSGWLIKATIPLLVSPHAFAEWSAAGVGSGARVALAGVELLGAALFAFEGPLTIGFALLSLSFVYAAVIHVRHGEMPWWLGGYFVGCVLLLYWTRRARVHPSAGTTATAGVHRSLSGRT
jgi:hypothetical protein